MGLGSGSYFDGTRTSLYVRPFLDVSRHLELSLDYELDRIRFEDRAQSLDAHITRFRARVYLSTALSGSAFLQYNSAVDAFVTNLRIRFNPREGQDLYLVWNEETNTGGFPPVPGGLASRVGARSSSSTGTHCRWSSDARSDPAGTGALDRLPRGPLLLGCSADVRPGDGRARSR